MSDNAELADRLAEMGRKLGQAMTDTLEQLRPAYDAVANLSKRPEVRAVIDGAEKVMRRRPCLCLCARVHPEDHDVCEMFDAVITGRCISDVLGDFAVPLCAPCAAARAARDFAG